MARSVVFRGTPRCPRCQMAPRWCVCEGARTVALPFAVDILMHNGEAHKPTSTGNLIGRLVPASRRIIYHNQRLPRREDVARSMAGHTLWILHPRGDVPDTPPDVLRGRNTPGASVSGNPGNLQILLLDGTWAQANDMLRHIDQWGRKICLPATALPGASRYWLRAQHHPGHFSTIEALMGLLNALGFYRESTALREQFELHVYASLLARGNKTRARQFLTDSPIKNTMPALVQKLQHGA